MKSESYEQQTNISLLCGYYDKDVRFAVALAYNYECQYCGKSVSLGESKSSCNKAVIEHLHPRHLGGNNRLSNYTLACPVCNGRKYAHLLPINEVIRLFGLARTKIKVIKEILRGKEVQYGACKICGILTTNRNRDAEPVCRKCSFSYDNLLDIKPNKD